MADLRLRTLRLLLWLALLLAVGLGGQAVVVAHQARARGLASGFPAPVGGADVDIPGVNAALEQYDGEALEAALARIAAGGFVWVRQSFYWSAIEPQPGRFDWAVPDRILAALARQPGLRLVAALDDKGAVTAPIPPPDSDRFASFSGAFAARYGAQVDYYQVWDEPNLAAHWGGGPVNPPAYADLLARSARAIREADPSARILLAGLAPTAETGPQNLSDVRYLEQLYDLGATSYFDVVTGKPYGFDTGPDDRRADESVLNFSRLVLLREVMERHGDAGKPIWASHWGWNALPSPEPAEGIAGWTGAPSIWGQTDEATQAARTVAALRRARAEWPWVGALILDHFQPFGEPDDPRWGFALVGSDGVPRPVYDAVAGWAAALPDAAPVGGYPALNPWATYEGDWRVARLRRALRRRTRRHHRPPGDRPAPRSAHRRGHDREGAGPVGPGGLAGEGGADPRWYRLEDRRAGCGRAGAGGAVRPRRAAGRLDRAGAAVSRLARVGAGGAGGNTDQLAMGHRQRQLGPGLGQSMVRRQPVRAAGAGCAVCAAA